MAEPKKEEKPFVFKKTQRGWIGVDMDGTLARYVPGDGIDTIGMPIKPMVELVREILSQGYEVRILTARVSPADGRPDAEIKEQEAMIGVWTEKHIGVKLKATCQKDFSMIALYDDRAYQVERNTGRVIKDVKRSA